MEVRSVRVVGVFTLSAAALVSACTGPISTATPQSGNRDVAVSPGQRQICSEQWKITGYFVPIEDDYSGPKKMVIVHGRGEMSFPITFLRATHEEGWGRTSQGWYLGIPDGSTWVTSAIAENAHGHELRIGSLAVDTARIPLGSAVTIPQAPTPWNNKFFVADDKGSAIKRQHLDIFTGEGKEAEKESFRVTTDGFTSKVCYEPPWAGGPTRVSQAAG